MQKELEWVQQEELKKWYCPRLPQPRYLQMFKIFFWIQFPEKYALMTQDPHNLALFVLWEENHEIVISHV